ncbi:ABC-2 transporter permease [Paenibacillus agri]|uniref:ABC-2 transporter permease n=1 Tax=Paenibacillus agri TaxID=2744309 RepID=A0A850ES99_9BACL|nr:ABC-2 transporter permease [Paenibacillus agri]NUU62154.1 ABC-2 transporter permease [Paenibacillus agri]
MYKSIHLIRKDFVLIRRFLLFLVPYYIYMATMSLHLYSLLATLPPLMLLINSCTQDSQLRIQRLLVSLPVRRKELVFSKYLALLPYTLFGAISILLFYLVTTVSGHVISSTSWQEIGITLAIFPLLASIYLPLNYWLGAKGAQVVNIVFMLAVMLLSESVQNLVNLLSTLTRVSEGLLSNHTLFYLFSGLLYIGLIGCSYFISLRIFVQKDV